MRQMTGDELVAGDLLACWGRGWQSRAISLWTASVWPPPGLRVGPSHVAVVCDAESRGRGGPLWVESTTMCRRPCVIRGEVVRGCQAHEPAGRIADYVAGGGVVECYRLAPIDRLSMAERARLQDLLLNHFVAAGRRYDFLGAALAGRRCGLLPRLIGADLEAVFCSEMAAAVLQRVCRMNRRNASWFTPARLLRAVVRQGTYQRFAVVVPRAESAA